MHWIALVMVFAAVALAVLALGEMLRGGEPGLADRKEGRGGATALPMNSPVGRIHRLVVGPLKDLLVREDDAEVHGVRQQLLQAGFHAPQAVAVYYATRLLLGGGLPLLVSPVAALVTDALALHQVTALSLLLAGLGYVGPAVYVGYRVRMRQRAVREGFPDTIDLLVICIEAGLGLDAAVARVGQEIAAAHPVVTEHLGQLAAELRAGRGREEAWRGLAQRVGLPEVSSLATLLIQTDRLGASAADALRAHSADLRARRLLRAEERAQELAVKMTFPLILLILPALMIVIATPAVIKGYRVLLPTISGSQR